MNALLGCHFKRVYPKPALIFFSVWLIDGFQCFDCGHFHAHRLKIGNIFESKNLKLLLENVSFYSIFLNVFVRFYRNFDIITLHRFQMTYQNLFSKSDLDSQKIAINCVPSSNVVGFFFTPKHGSFSGQCKHVTSPESRLFSHRNPSYEG